MAFTLPDLPYPYDALAPHMSRETLEFHHDKHHQAYVNAGNNLAKGTEWENKPVEEVVKGTFGKNPGLFNNAAQHYNHIHFWKWMKKGGGGEPKGELAEAIKSTFGSFAAFQEKFGAAGLGRFGSGWAWLIVKDGKLAIDSTPNQDTPISLSAKAVLGLDVWEHAYYLKYQNVRGDYIKAWWNVVNWDSASEHYAAAKK